MNRLEGTIREVIPAGGLTLVEVEVGDIHFTAITLRSPGGEPDLRAGQAIVLGFNEMETSIARDLQGGLSIRNRIPGMIRRLEKGELLTRVHLDFRGRTLCSVITTRSADGLKLREGEEVLALVKTNEILLLQHGE